SVPARVSYLERKENCRHVTEAKYQAVVRARSAQDYSLGRALDGLQCRAHFRRSSAHSADRSRIDAKPSAAPSGANRQPRIHGSRTRIARGTLGVRHDRCLLCKTTETSARICAAGDDHLLRCLLLCLNIWPKAADACRLLRTAAFQRCHELLG